MRGPGARGLKVAQDKHDCHKFWPAMSLYDSQKQCCVQILRMRF